MKDGMRFARRQFVPGVIAVVVISWFAYFGRSVALARERAPVSATRLYTGGDGLSHIEQVNIKFAGGTGAASTAEESDPVKVESSYVVRLAPGVFEGWHNADHRRYVIPISGRAEIEVGGGQKFILEPGKICIAEDLTGKGHTFRVLGDSDWVAIFVEFAE